MLNSKLFSNWDHDNALFVLQERLKLSEWLDLNVFMNFNKLAGFLNATFERVDPSDLYTALSTISSDFLEVRQTGECSEDIHAIVP